MDGLLLLRLIIRCVRFGQLLIECGILSAWPRKTKPLPRRSARAPACAPIAGIPSESNRRAALDSTSANSPPLIPSSLNTLPCPCSAARGTLPRFDACAPPGIIAACQLRRYYPASGSTTIRAGANKQTGEIGGQVWIVWRGGSGIEPFLPVLRGAPARARKSGSGSSPLPANNVRPFSRNRSRRNYPIELKCSGSIL
jgi:hypothetical protein